jgi:Arc/MetJ family transcription regulator
MKKRTTVTLDDALLTKASALTGITETSPLIKAALTALIQRESARRLALLSGSNPNMESIPRRSSEPSVAMENEVSAVRS